MSPLSSAVHKLALLALLLPSTLAQDCESYGIDFQSGQTYFQNSLSSDNFTFVSQFEGCQNDTANNLLVDPNGEQYLCTDTDLQPDDTNQLSTCPQMKSQLFTGDWSVLIISNNGNGTPIAYERDFSLTVGPQATTTYTPTVTATVLATAIANATSTTTSVTSTTLTPVTVTKPSKTITHTVTTTPARVTVTTTKTLATITKWSPTLSIIQKTKTKTASCITPIRAPSQDPIASITPTIAGITASALETSAATSSQGASAKFLRLKDRSAAPGGENFDIAKFLKERRARLAAQPLLLKRSPDQATLTVTDANTTDYKTTTTTSYSTTSTVTYTITATSTATVTPAVVTVLSGKSVAPAVTVTAPTPTKTLTHYTVITSSKTKTWTKTITVTSETYPAATVDHCINIGGILE